MIISDELLYDIDSVCKEYDAIPWTKISHNTDMAQMHAVALYGKITDLSLKFRPLPLSVQWIVFLYMIRCRRFQFDMDQLRPIGNPEEEGPIHNITNFVRYFKLDYDYESSFYFTFPIQSHRHPNITIVDITNGGSKLSHPDLFRDSRSLVMKAATLNDAILARLSL